MVVRAFLNKFCLVWSWTNWRARTSLFRWNYTHFFDITIKTIRAVCQKVLAICDGRQRLIGFWVFEFFGRQIGWTKVIKKRSIDRNFKMSLEMDKEISIFASGSWILVYILLKNDRLCTIFSKKFKKIAKLGIFRQKVAHFGDFWHKSGDFHFYCISRKIRAFGANWHFSVVFSVVWWLFDHTSVVWF